MSTLTPSEAGRPPTWDAIIQERDEQPSRQAAFIPRSALVDGALSGRVSNINAANSLLNTQGYSNVNIDIPLNTQSSLHMELTHDGKVTELVARFEQYYAGCSDASEESYDGDTRASSAATHHSTEAEAGTVRASPSEHIELGSTAHTVGHAGQSPRKQLPAHWMPKSAAPKLATAQRAKERTHKKGSESGSPVEVKTLRGTRSSVELGKAHGKEGPTYLTKEALAAVDSSVTSPASPLSPNRAYGSPSKRLWNSPTGSPLRSSTRQHPTLSIKMSPTKSRHLNAGSMSTAHSRTSSSVANSFHTAEGSPVRSPASTEDSFQFAAENPENADVLSLDLMADSDDKQVLPGSSSPRSSAMKAKTESKASALKPKLVGKIPPSEGTSSASQNSAETLTLTSATSDSYMSNSPWGPEPAVRESRIPRVGATSKIAVPTRSATLKRAQSVKDDLATKIKIMQRMQAEPHEVPLPHTPAHQIPLPETPAHQIPLPKTPAPTARPHVRTVNSSGTTPIISRTSNVECRCLGDTGASELTSDNVEQGHDSVDSANKQVPTPLANRHADAPAPGLLLVDMLGLEALRLQAEAIPLPPSGHTSRAASNATVRASQDTRDPVLMDSSIIYSRKKSDAFGTALARPPITLPTITVMMAHTLDLGTLHLHNDATSAGLSRAEDSLDTTSPIRGRSDRYVPSARRQADSEHSTQSSMGSDLRADAPVFVYNGARQAAPQAAPTTTPYNAAPTATPSEAAPDGTTLVPLAALQDLPDLPPDISAVDANGIPWLFYMYQTQFAYEQGFRYGRMRSPKKFKHKKQRSSISSPSDVHQPQSSTRAVPTMGSENAGPSSDAPKQRMTSSELMPPPPLPANRREDAHPSHQQQTSESTFGNNEPTEPFSTQLNMIAEQAALRNRTNTHTNSPRHFNVGVDLTTIRNVGLPTGPRNMNMHGHGPTYYTVPRRRHPNNGLYGGRGGAAGIPMDATAPFPQPVPPQGRQMLEGARPAGYTIGREACGAVQIANPTEWQDGPPCNACAPDH
jgi:hypothetical protein